MRDRGGSRGIGCNQRECVHPSPLHTHTPTSRRLAFVVSGHAPWQSGREVRGLHHLRADRASGAAQAACGQEDRVTDYRTLAIVNALASLGIEMLDWQVEALDRMMLESAAEDE